MKQKRALHLELNCIILVVLLLTVFYYWYTLQPLDPYVDFAFGVGASVILILLFFTIRAILRLEQSSVIGLKARMLFARAIGYFISVMDKWGWFGRGRKDVISGKTTLNFDFTSLDEPKHKPFKAPKWKDMRATREKLGFVYYTMITKRISKGFAASSSDTPLELKHRESNSELEEEIFDLYIDARYDDRFELDEKTVLELKNRINEKS